MNFKLLIMLLNDNIELMELKNIIFDFGGVLIDWDPVYLYSKIFNDEREMNYFLENVCRYDWNIQQDAGRPLAEATSLLQEEFPHYTKQIGYYYDRWEEMLGGTIDENVKLIKPLKNKYNVYGLTNWSAETLPIAIEMYDFFNDLDGIVVSGEEKLIKPNREIYHVLLNRFGVVAEESLFIDDNADNINTANEIGFKTIHYTNNLNLAELLRSKKIL